MAMDKGEYWILDALVEVGCRLRLIDPARIDRHFSPGHGLDRMGLVAVLDRLLRSGDLEAERDVPVSEPVSFLPIRSGITAMLWFGDPEVSLYLTPQGGRRWEELSVPDWGRYVSTDWGEAGWWGVASADRRLVERYFQLPDVQARVVPGSEVWDVLAPWQATYWKTLPVGHRVRFRLTESEEQILWAESDEDWYKNYF